MLATDVVRLVVYLEGQDAASGGVERRSNPYADGCVEQAIEAARNAWFDGWDDADRESASNRQGRPKGRP